jgi:RNA polymerase sigma factor (sigma-70 family)
MPPPPAELFASRIFLGPALRAQPDRRLVDLVRDGYDAAFEEIVRRYRKQLDRFAAAIVGGRSEDVTQDAFSKALLALRGSEAEIELRPWLYRIVRNTALNDLRDHAPAAEEIPETLPGSRSTAAEAETREEMRDLMTRLQALPEPQRAALVMRELEGLSHEEIAAALGVSGGAARQVIYRARAALREGLGLLLPLPALRMFAEHGAEMVKAGTATALIAGTFGAGVAIKHHQVGDGSSNVAEAAPLVGAKHASATPAGESASSSSFRPSDNGRRDSVHGTDDHHGNGSDDRGGSLGDGSRSASGGPGPSGGGSDSGKGSSNSGEGSRNSGPGSSGDDDSGSGDRRGGSGSSGSGDDGGGSNSGSGSNDDGGSSGGSGGSDDSFSTFDDGGGGSSGPGSGEIESEPSSEPELSESDGGGSGTSGDDSSESGGSSGSGSGDITTNSSESPPNP